jgi:hypothetical protein
VCSSFSDNPELFGILELSVSHQREGRGDVPCAIERAAAAAVMVQFRDGVCVKPSVSGVEASIYADGVPCRHRVFGA